MVEELTSLMHSEFRIDKSTELKHQCWSALTMIKDIKNTMDIAFWAEIYDVSVEDIKRVAKIKKG